MQQHTCRERVSAVLNLRAHSSVGNCSTEADSRAQSSTTVLLSLLQPVGSVIGLGSAQAMNCGCAVDRSKQDKCGEVVKYCCEER